MNLKDMLNSEPGRIVIAAVLGFGLSTLFRKSCKDENCIKFKAPDLDKIEGKTYRHNGQCYQFSASSGTCNKGRETIRFA
jgi:hypothetical protein